MVYTLHFFSSKCSLFHNSSVFGSCIIHILYTVCAKIKKNHSGAKRLKYYLSLLCDEIEVIIPEINNPLHNVNIYYTHCIRPEMC
jgi:hypothetical protein